MGTQNLALSVAPYWKNIHSERRMVKSGKFVPFKNCKIPIKHHSISANV